MRFNDIDGSPKKPGDLIDFYGKIYGVNPRFLLALIQKEQSLVDDASPSQCQIDWATGYGRPDGSLCDDPAWQRYRGFTTQIVSAANFIRSIYDQDQGGVVRTFGFFPGVAASIDGQAVIPANRATAILYSYTPHLHGNQNLRAIWMNWFTLGYPDGSVLSADDGSTYLIQGGTKRLFANKSALRTRVKPEAIIGVPDAVLAAFADGPAIRFADYSLERVPDGTIYLLDGNTKRPIASMAVFRSIGFNPMEIDDADPADLEGYATGEPITLESSYPTGGLLQDAKTGGVYLVADGKKHPIVDGSILKADYAGKKIVAVAPEKLTAFTTDAPVRFHDGDLVTGPGPDRAVYVISNGERRPIVSAAAFDQLGYSWKAIIPTTAVAIALHPLGLPVTGAPPAAAPGAPATLASN
jgi:hypothetical protein